MKVPRFSHPLISGVLTTIIIAGALSLNAHGFAQTIPGSSPSQGQQGCVQLHITGSGESTLTMPDACVDGLCKIILYTDGVMGAFGEGYSWETTYRQDSGDNSWIGGPNVSLGGYSYSEGNGVNGDSTASGIHLGATTADGGYVRLLDDGVLENSPDQWTIQSQVSEGLQRAIITICPLAGCVSHTFTTDAYWPIQTPSFCKDRLCSVRMYTDAPMGAFGPGISWPVYYEQKSTDATWIGGPVVSILGTSFSGGNGTNGDGSYHQILSHGTTTFGGSSILYDDSSSETSQDL